MGRVYLGYPKTVKVEVQTRGDLPLNFETRGAGDSVVFSVAPLSGTIPINGNILLSVTAAPQRLGQFEFIVFIFSDASTEKRNAELRITAEGRLPPDCEDGNGCTRDHFDPVTQACVFEMHEGTCDDRNRCTQNDLCRAGECLGESIVCDDEDVCTDNLCNPSLGCVFPQTRSCDDQNPCTKDSCLAPEGCTNELLPNGTLCDDIELCTEADVCSNGFCVGVAIPDGTPCDDLDPCSKEESCQEGECIDETYTPPGPGELKFDTLVGTLTDDSGRNPIMDGDGSIYLGTARGVVALDSCGELLWHNESLGEPSWRAALSLPGRIYVPVGAAVVTVDTETGAELERLDLRAFTSSTSSTALVSIKNMALQNNGALVISVKERDGIDNRFVGYLVNWMPGTSKPRLRYEIGGGWFDAIGLDQNDKLTAVLTMTSTLVSSGKVDHLVRYDLALDSLNTSVSTTVAQASTHFALGSDRNTYWSTGIRYDEATLQSHPVALLDEIDSTIEHGAPTVGSHSVYWPINQAAGSAGQGQNLASSNLIATSTAGEVQWARALQGSVSGSSATIDGNGNIYILTNSGELYGYSEQGLEVLSYSANQGNSVAYVSNPTLSPRAVLVFGFIDRVIGIQMTTGLGATPWPRYRHDNLSTSHQ
jgi:hypothetical protein